MRVRRFFQHFGRSPLRLIIGSEEITCSRSFLFIRRYVRGRVALILCLWVLLLDEQ